MLTIATAIQHQPGSVPKFVWIVSCWCIKTQQEQLGKKKKKLPKLKGRTKLSLVTDVTFLICRTLQKTNPPNY